MKYGLFSVKHCAACALFAGLSLAGVKTAVAQPDVTDFFQSALTCVLVEPLLADMPVESVYAQEGTTCAAAVPDESDRTYFTDTSCLTPLNFEATSLASHCDLLLDSDQLGEGAGVTTPVWTLSPGSRLDVGARPLDNVPQPYLQRLVYRNIDTDRGVCSLEMRVYANSPITVDDVTRPSLLALHGGSWSARGFGFFGLELTIPHYVEQGFVVYAPFYRLLGDSEGSAACNQASIQEIADDASAALDWVADNAVSYGSSPVPVVFGQSAGAHLATSLLVNEPERVAGAVLFYPPTDFTDFTLRAQQGLYTDEQGLGILERVLGVGANTADINASPIPENSFPIRIVEQGIEVPPVMMVHGMRDTLVEARQSVRLCDALSGRLLQAVDDEVNELATLREVIACGANSELHLISEGQHALDVCFADSPVSTDLCPSGSDASRAEVSSAIGEAAVFAASLSLSGADSTDNDGSSGSAGSGDNNAESGDDVIDMDSQSQSSGSGGGGIGYWWLIALSLCLIRKFKSVGREHVNCTVKQSNEKRSIPWLAIRSR